MLRATRSLPARTRLVALGLQLHVRTMAKKGRGPTNSSSNVVTMHGLKKVLPGGRVLLENVNLKLTAGAKVGVLGANGAGKSSFLRVLAGWDAEVEGEHWIREGLKVGMLEQEPRLDDERDVLSNIMDGVGEQRDALARFEAVNLELAQAMAELEVLDCWDLDSQIKAAMHALNCPPGDAMPGPLSGGQKRRVALCRLLVSKPDLMMLDEPTNHLDASSVQWLEGYLERYKGSVVAVTRRR
jgi:sulfate-transporting ATPase